MPPISSVMVLGFGPLHSRRRTSSLATSALNIPSFEAPFTPCVEIGWRLAAHFWNQGLATEGAAAVLRFAHLTLGIGEVVSFTSVHNLPSRRVMEKIGMTRDIEGDFDHPRIPKEHPLCRHVLYRARR